MSIPLFLLYLPIRTAIMLVIIGIIQPICSLLILIAAQIFYFVLQPSTAPECRYFFTQLEWLVDIACWTYSMDPKLRFCFAIAGFYIVSAFYVP